MQKAAFFTFLFLVVIFLSFVRFNKGNQGNQKESFTNFFGFNFSEKNDGTPSVFDSKNATIPVAQPYAPNLAEMGVGNILPGPDSPQNLPKAPYGNISKAVPTPYKDPTVEPAKYIRILGVKEDLQAFFAFQAGPIEESSDPSIQMPLTRARADVGELVDLQSVLERNPGLPSRMTNKQLDDVQSNLRYLQSIVRDLEASGAITTGVNGVEGFEDSKDAENAEDAKNAEDAEPATLDQLKDFQTKIQAEIARLSASATTEPVIVARINNLTRILGDVTDTITKTESGFYTADTIPIYASDIKKALPILGKPTDPLPSILSMFNLPPAIASLFPGGLSPKNTEQAAQINNVMKGYMKQIFEGTSWGLDLNVKYDSPRAEKIYGQSHINIDVGMPGFEGSTVNDTIDGINASWKKLRTVGRDAENARNAENPENAVDAGNSSYGRGLPGSSDRTMPGPIVGRFDWKQRSSEILTQVKRRGLNPLLFGALPENTEVSDSFNWKGYTNMLCTRLSANYDPGLPLSVGCPSLSWPGWKQSN